MVALSGVFALSGCEETAPRSSGEVDVGGPVAFADATAPDPDAADVVGADTSSPPDTRAATDTVTTPDTTPAPDTSGACTADGIACDDGDLCTVNDQCVAGACVGSPVDCNDLVPCTNDQCVAGVCNNSIVPGFCIIGGVCYTDGSPNPQNACQSCQAGANATGWSSGATCDDGNPCTTNDTCTPGGGCAGTPLTCPDDGNPCTIEACSNGTCVTTQSPGPCEDGNPCTVGDTCINQVCQPGTGQKDADNDGAIDLACGGTDCNDNANAVKPGAPEVCGDGLDNDCNGQTDMSDDVCNQPVECVDQLVCNDIDLVCGFWASQNKNLCSSPCSGINDCPSGQTCTKMPGSASVGYCQDAVGPISIGGECTSDAQCASYLCEFGFCLEPCLDQNACTFATDTCTPVGNLQAGPLRSACLPDGELLANGQPCKNDQGLDDSSVCSSGHCDLLSSVPGCAPICTSEADCLPAQECNLVLYTEGTNPNTLPVVQGVFQVDTHDAMMACYTAPNPGFKGVGETCTNNEQCTSNKCLAVIPNDPTQYCTSYCTGDEECPSDMNCVIEVISLVDTWLQAPTIQTQPANPNAFTIVRVCKP